MTFVAELTTLDGQARGQPAWRGLTIEHNLNGGMTATLTIDGDDQAAAEARVGERVLRVWQDEHLRFHGKLREPLVYEAGSVQLVAGSPWTLLDRRQLQAQQVFTAVDQGIIVRLLLDAENARSPTRLRLTSYPASIVRDRTYEIGKSVRDIISELADVIDGFYFLERPLLDRSTNDYTELILRWPAAGQDRPAVRLEYGEGTLGNLAGYQLTESLPVNAVTYAGGPGFEGDTTPVRRMIDTASVVTYDLLEAFYSEPDVIEEVTLLEKAAAALRPDPSLVASVETVAGGPGIGGPPLPELWNDFGPGDTIYLSVRDDAVERYDVPVRVTQARLTVSELDDSEQLDLTLDEPANMTVARPPDDLFLDALMSDHERRLRGLAAAQAAETPIDYEEIEA